MAKLHTICGNCGCNNQFEYEINARGHCDSRGFETPAVFIICRNCGTLHDLVDNAKENVRTDNTRENLNKRWLIHFDDVDAPDDFYTDEDCAVKAFVAHSANWSCTLYKQINSRRS